METVFPALWINIPNDSFGNYFFTIIVQILLYAFHNRNDKIAPKLSYVYKVFLNSDISTVISDLLMNLQHTKYLV